MNSFSATCRVFICISAALATALAVAAQEGAAPDKKAEKVAAVSLDATVVLAKSGPTLAFTMTNNSGAPVEAWGVSTDPNRIVIVTPEGAEVERFSSVGLVPGAAVPTIAPAESRTWQVDVSNFLVTTNKFTKPGTYKIHWKYLHREGNGPLVVYKSNVIPILREKDTPVISPFTGRVVPPEAQK